MAKKHMDFIRKAGGQKAKKLLAVILAAGMAMTALPGETITALAQEAEGQKNVLLAEEVSGSETDMPEEDTVSGDDGQAEDVIPGGDSRRKHFRQCRQRCLRQCGPAAGRYAGRNSCFSRLYFHARRRRSGHSGI